MQALVAMTIPNAPAVKMDITTSRFEKFLSSYIGTRQPGKMPQLPAVGVATMRPMAALQLLTASARAMALVMRLPVKPPLCSAYCFMR